MLDSFGIAQGEQEELIMTVNCEFLIERVFIEILTIQKNILVPFLNSH